jgi:tRNA (guanine37-N1)-methyltransferase
MSESRRQDSLPVLRFDVITLFPEIIEAACGFGVLSRGIADGILYVRAHQLRDYTGGSPHLVDDDPYGGGPGMVMRAEPIFDAVEDVSAKIAGENPGAPVRKILTTPQGARFDQSAAHRLHREGTRSASILILCGRYEGVDERVRGLFDEELSLGDFVMTGGEIAAAAVIDAVGRLVPGVLGSGESPVSESFSEDLLEYPQFTRPEEFRGMRVPPVLLSGNHAEIERWRREQATARTRERRPDLLTKEAKNLED